ncbi:MAG: hemerythrin domain-containing protein [Pseudomonadota bacterium]
MEDEHYFPLLTGEDPRLAAAFDLLDADHGVLDGRIHGLADRINRALGLLGDARLLRGEAGPLIDDLEAMRALLDRHLTDEEEIVVPIILEHAPKALSG